MYAALCDWIEENIQGDLFPGATAAIGRGSACLWRGAFGTLDGVRSTTLRTCYDMASLTKVLSTTMVTFELIRRGELDLDDPVARFFPVRPQQAAIRIRHLLTHTSGIPDFRIDECLGRRGYTLAEAVRASLDAPSLWAPGTDTQYSCNGYIILGAILSMVGGASLDILAREFVFAPLDMHNTGYPPVIGDCAPTGWDPEMERHVCAIQYDRNSRYMDGVSGNAGIFSTIDDMTRFASMLAMHGRTPHGEYMPEAQYWEMIRCHTNGCLMRRGLGFMLADEQNDSGGRFPREAFGHTGSSGTCLFIDPSSGVYAVTLTNRLFSGRDDARILRFRRRFHDLAWAAAHA